MGAELRLDLMTAALLVVVLAAGVCDVRTRRIPNVVTVSGFLLALGLRFAAGPAAGIDGLTGGLLAFVLCLPFFVLGVVGGGDAKLLVTVGAFLGPRDLLMAMLLIASIGGILGALEAARKGVLLPVLYNCGDILKSWATLGRRGHNRSLTSSGAVAVPYGVAIGLGALLWWFARLGSL